MMIVTSKPYEGKQALAW